MVDIGDPAPDFVLQGVKDGEIREFSLDSLTNDAALVMGVYVYDYSPVCRDQMCDIADLNWLNMSDDVNVVGISGDGPYSHMQFMNDTPITYPLLCDTSKEVVKSYGVLHREKDGFMDVPKRSVFLIGPDKRIRYRWVAEDNWDTWTGEPIQAVRQEIGRLEEVVT